jgi:hypothetical protein
MNGGVGQLSQQHVVGGVGQRLARVTQRRRRHVVHKRLVARRWRRVTAMHAHVLIARLVLDVRATVACWFVLVRQRPSRIRRVLHNTNWRRNEPLLSQRRPDEFLERLHPAVMIVLSVFCVGCGDLEYLPVLRQHRRFHSLQTIVVKVDNH